MQDKSQGPPLSGLLVLGGRTGSLGCVTPLIIIGAIFLGRWLDNLLGTRPVILLMLILVSIPFSLFVVVRAAMDATRIEQARFRQSQKDAGDTPHNSFYDDSGGR
jgi:multisubunit Na+/H+ antiporter MnhG subunit